MLQAVPVADPEWSGAHVGLCLYVGRLLQPLWETQVIGHPTGTGGKSILDCRILPSTLEVMAYHLLTPPCPVIALSLCFSEYGIPVRMEFQAMRLWYMHTTADCC